MRIDLAGDGTDLDAYSKRYGGLAISVTIDKYVYVVLSPTENQISQVTSSADFINLFRSDMSAADTDLVLPQAVLNRFGMSTGLSVFVALQVPANTGLGASTASGIALACALSGLNHKALKPKEVADLVANIAIDRLNRPVARHDAYAIAVGGLTATQFAGDDVSTRRLRLSDDVWRAFEAELILFYTGRPQNAGAIWAEQKKGTERNRASVIESLHVLKNQAEQLRRHLESGELDAVGPCLDASWQAKKNLARTVSDPWIDQWYQTAVDAGATGGKICGPGGGGFLVVTCPPQHHDRVTQALEAAGLVRVSFHLESEGVSIVSGGEGQLQKNGIGARQPNHVSSN